MPTIRLEGVTKMYKTQEHRAPAVLNVNLTIEQGEFIFLIGSRGAGKSTLLDLITGVQSPDKGAVYVDDVDMRRMNRRQRTKLRRDIGRVSQEPALVRTETILKNFSSKSMLDILRNRVVNEPLIQKSLGLVGMAGCEEKFPMELSVSECQRVELAKAILNSPSILVLDEMPELVDEDTIWDILHLLNELNTRGTTILMVSNIARFVNIMRKRVVTLSDGKIVGDVRKGRYGYIT